MLIVDEGSGNIFRTLSLFFEGTVRNQKNVRLNVLNADCYEKEIFLKAVFSLMVGCLESPVGYRAFVFWNK